MKAIVGYMVIFAIAMGSVAFVVHSPKADAKQQSTIKSAIEKRKQALDEI